MKVKRCIICHGNKLKKLFKKYNYQIVRCQLCNFIFVNPSPNKYQLDSYYKKFNYDTGFINEDLIRSDSLRIINNLKKLGFYKGLVLDIGCGAGFFLDEARKSNWNVQGIDLSRKTSNYAKSKLKLNIINSDFLTYKFPHNKFRVITLIQVIEHLANPRQMFGKIYKLLEHDGLLYIATPNINSYLSKILQKDFTYMIPPEHIAFYSKDTLMQILSEAGFKIIKINTLGYPADLASIIKYLIKQDVKYQYRTINNKICNISYKKKIKHLIFDLLFCRVFYKLLNFNFGGSILEIYVQK